MTKARTLTTVAAAAALLGAIGLTYAQSTAPTYPAASSSMMPTPTMPGTMTNSGQMAPIATPPMKSSTLSTNDSSTSGSSASTSTDSGTMPAERAPKAVRG